MWQGDDRVQFSDNTEIGLDAVPSQHPDVIESEEDPDDDPDVESHCQGYTLGDEEVNIMADPSVWRPFLSNCQFLCREGKNIGFCTRSGVVFGPERIEVMPNIKGHLWMFHFIVHEYSVLLDFPASLRVQHN